MSSALLIKNLNKIYANQFQALHDISFSVEQGDFFALLGPNGAGKSTIIGIICSLINKSSGKVHIFDKDIDTDFVDARRNLGIVPQEFNFNIFEPVAEIVVNQAGYYGIPRKPAFERAEYYLNKLGLWGKRKESARNLSGGMKRRLMIARALVHEPRLLVLDEPTAGVDIEIRRTMWEFMRELNESGVTIILTTHYLEEAESLCRHVAIINEGKLIRDTSIRELISQLSCETFILDLASAVDEKFCLDNIPTRLIDPTTLEIDIAKEYTINDVFEILKKQGIVVTSLRNKSNRLEQTFLNMVTNTEKVNEL
ncbi:Uncharacterized ABC transporter ATP-binding protein YadG [hydrothermal vent metagenome]|uniref:Uncharacterized ABC transporter ATP-binding protein YadG n=1 Tax=hydrothermal vent metagenome TaxID=652676 RepID=A0A3B0YXC9_9ZZZZ